MISKRSPEIPDPQFAGIAHLPEHRSERMAFLVARRTAQAARVSTSRQMVTSHMKPYTTIDVLPGGTRYLPMQWDGARPSEVAQLLQGRRLLSCRVPSTQSASLAWQVILNFDSNVSLELTSSSTVVQGWDEFGTINVEILSSALVESKCEWVNLELSEALDVTCVEVVRWQGAGLIVDSGIRLHFSDDRILSVVAMDVPGALLLTLPGDAAPCSWQFPADEYVFVSIEGAG